MIVGITIRNFKGIKEIIDLPLEAFHVLVGPNASGKTTFLDAIDFMRDCLIDGPKLAVESRNVSNFDDLTWMKQGGTIEVSIWFDFSRERKELSDSLVLYRLAIKQDVDHGVCVSDEILQKYSKSWLPAGTNFAFSDRVKPTRLLGKTSKGTDFYARETSRYQDSFNFGVDKLTLALTPPDEDRYPTANLVRKFLMQGVRYIQLDSPGMRLPCSATRSAELDMDGTNIARVVSRLIGRKNGEEISWIQDGTDLVRWIDHLRFALPDLKNIGCSRRIADNAEYIVVQYENGLEAPSWVLSDGTLRMLALTLLAFMPPESAMYMVEEPENGVHPKALEIIMRSLSTIPSGQMLVATHSPFVVQQSGIKPLLCFNRGSTGTTIVHGIDHPILKDWDGEPDLGIVFAAGILE